MKICNALPIELKAKNNVFDFRATKGIAKSINDILICRILKYKPNDRLKKSENVLWKTYDIGLSRNNVIVGRTH